MTARVEAAAPAKTNLFLEVVRRRPDGFHELDTVFAELTLADGLAAEPASAGRIELIVAGAGAEVPAGPANLVWRAADALRRRAGRPDLGARLELTKRIPPGGGLGGGSSDAAAALRVLNRLWGADLGAEALHALAAELGSDVAFFLRGGLQRGVGRGEVLTALPTPPRPLHLVALLPPFGCPTPAVFGALAPHLPAAPRRPDALLAALATGEPAAAAAALFNRLEAAAFELFPALRDLAQRLRATDGVLGVVLSGSGSTLIGVAADEAAAAEAVAALTGQGLSALATATASGVDRA